MSLGAYILDGKTPVLCEDTKKWGEWYETASRRVDLTEAGGIRVSTVFLAIDHALDGEEPALFETMAFGTDEEICRRYSTWEQAEAGHKEVCREVFDTQEITWRR